MKQSAVEFIEQHLFLDDNWRRIFQQAKEIEKQQRNYSEEDIALAFNEEQEYSVNGKLYLEQQQGYNYKKVCEIERFRAIDFAKWFADFNGLTWEEKRVSKEHLDNLYEQYLKTLGGGI